SRCGARERPNLQDHPPHGQPWRQAHVPGASGLPAALALQAQWCEDAPGMLPTFEPLCTGLIAMEVAAAPRASKAALAQGQRRRLSALLATASRSSLYGPWLQDRDPDQVA